MKKQASRRLLNLLSPGIALVFSSALPRPFHPRNGWLCRSVFVFAVPSKGVIEYSRPEKVIPASTVTSCALSQGESKPEAKSNFDRIIGRKRQADQRTCESAATAGGVLCVLINFGDIRRYIFGHSRSFC